MSPDRASKLPQKLFNLLAALSILSLYDNRVDLLRSELKTMLKAFVSALLALGLLAGQTHALAAASAAEVEEIACKAGLCQQVDAMHQQMLDSLDEIATGSAPAIDAAVIQRLRQVADRAYASDRLRANLMRELTKRLDEKDVPALQQWFNSPAGQVIAKAEQANANVDLHAPVDAGSQLLASSSAERVALIKDILVQSHTAEAMVDIIINTTLAVRNGVMVASPGMPHGDTRELRASLESRRPAMIESFTKVSLPITANSYAAVSDADLARYLQFMKTEQGARFNEVSIRSFESALMIAAAEFGSGIPGSRKGLDA